MRHAVNLLCFIVIQVASMFDEASSVLEGCIESVSHCEELKTLLRHQKDFNQLDHNGKHV